MTSGTIAEGAVAGHAGSAGARSGAALYGKNADASRTGQASAIRGSGAILNAGKSVSVSGSAGGVQTSQLGAVGVSSRSAAEQHAVWKDEFAGQTSGLMEVNDPPGLPDPLDLPNSSDPADSSAPASFSQANPGFQPAKQSAFSAGFPAGGQLPSLVRTKASELGLAGLPRGRAGVNGEELPSSPGPTILTSTPGSAQRITREGSEATSKAGASTRDSHASSPSRDWALHPGETSPNPPLLPSLPLSAFSSLPVALPELASFTVQAPSAAGNRMQDESQTAASRPVRESGIPAENSVLAKDSGPSSGRSAVTPAAGVSLAANSSAGSSLPTGLEARNLPGGAPLAGAGSTARNWSSGTESSSFAANLNAVRDSASSPRSSPDHTASLDPATHTQDGIANEVAFSAEGLSLSPVHGSLAPSQSATNLPDLRAVVQSHGVVSVTGPVSKRGASLRGVADAVMSRTGGEPSAIVSANVQVDAVNLDRRAPLGTDSRPAANQETMPGAESSPAGLSGLRGAGKTLTKSPAAQSALVRGPGSASADASFPHFNPSETGSVAAVAVAPETNRGSATSPPGAVRNPFEAMDQMDQAKGSAGASGPNSRVAAASPTGDTSQALQVGYQDPVLGYVELRAHSGANGIHASLETQSAAAGDSLTAHLSALTGWMNERRTPVESLTVSTLVSQQDSPRHERDSSAQGDGAGSQSGNSGFGHANFGDGSLADRSEERSSVSSLSPPRTPSVTASGIQPDLAVVQAVGEGSAASFVLPALSGSSFSIVV